MTYSFARYLVLSIDAQGYGRAPDQGQIVIQTSLSTCVLGALLGRVPRRPCGAAEKARKLVLGVNWPGRGVNLPLW